MKERLVTCNEEDTDGRARVTRDVIVVIVLLAFKFMTIKKSQHKCIM